MTSPARATGSRRLVWILGAALGVALLLLVVSLLRPTEAPPAATSQSPTAEDAEAATAEREAREALEGLARRVEGDYTAIGQADAPLVLIEYADYRCPFCGAFARETMPLLVEEYVDDGLVRIEWRDLPVFGEESFAAAVAARAAGEQGRYWEYHHAVFAGAGAGKQALPRERLLEIAREAGVPDLAAFEAGLEDPALIEAVGRDAQEAQALGIASTPTFIVGQQPIMGAQPADAFRQVIEDELARMGY